MYRTGVRERLFSLFSTLDGPLTWVITVLLSVGMIVLISASSDMPWLVVDQLRNLLIAMLVMWAMSHVQPQTLMRVAVPLYTVGVGLLIAVMMFGLVKKGARRWIDIGLVVQPSEMMKIAMPLMLAWYFQKREATIKAIDYLAAAILLGLPVALIARQPDLGTALLVLMAGVFVIFFAGLSWRLILPVVVAAITGIVLLVVYEPTLCSPDFDWVVLYDYQKHRVCTLLDPSSDPLGKGFHTIQSIIAIGSGGLHGKGWMKGTQTHLEFIPEKHTDFIFAVYAEEFGLLGNLLLIGLYLLLIGRGLSITANAATLFSRLLAGAITMIFFTYAFVNLAMVSGLLPVVGVPLPFISYGGTSLVTLAMGAGILMSIARHKRFVQT